MAIEWARARCRCDQCYAWFEVELDTAYEVEPGNSLTEAVENAVRLGMHVVNCQTGSGRQATSMREEDMLCGACTMLEAAKG